MVVDPSSDRLLNPSAREPGEWKEFGRKKGTGRGFFGLNGRTEKASDALFSEEVLRQQSELTQKGGPPPDDMEHTWDLAWDANHNSHK